MDILNVGVDISGFSPDKLAVLKEYISVFEKLDSYDKTKFTPTSGEGLTAFNTAIKNTSQLLDDLNDKIAFLNTQSQLSGKGASSAAQSQTELGLAVSQYAKNANEAAVATSKLSVAQSTQAKETANAKAKLSEVNRELNTNAKAETESGKAMAMSTLRAKEKAIETQRVVGVLRAQWKEQEMLRKAEISDNAKTTKNEAKQSRAQEIEERKQMTAAYKAEIVMQEEAAAAKIAEGKANKILLDDYGLLKQALKDQQIAYTNNYINKGSKHPDTISAKKEMEETAALVNRIGSNINDSTSSIGGMGKSLSGAYSTLRRIAYILPGIGIAGIFNLAFKAIGDAAESMGLFSEQISKEIKFKEILNKLVKEEVANREELLKIKKDSLEYRNYSEDASSRTMSLKEARGWNQDYILNKKLEDAKKLDLKTDVTRVTNGDEIHVMEDQLKYKQEKLDQLNQRLLDIDSRIKKKAEEENTGKSKHPSTNIGGKFKPGGVVISSATSIDNLEKEKKDVQDLLKIKQDEISRDKALINESIKNYTEQLKAKEALEKFNYDQALKRQVESGKLSIEKNIDKNNQIISDDRNFEYEKTKSIKKIYQDQLAINQIERIKVTGNITKEFPLGDNIETNPKEKLTAFDRESRENYAALVKEQEELHKIRDHYREIEIASLTEIIKNEQDIIAQGEENINKDVHENLDKRLNSLINYYNAKTTISEAEYRKESSRHGVTPEEELALVSDKQKKDREVELEMPKKIYDTIMSWAKRELTDLSEIHKQKAAENESAFMVELKQLDDHYAAKLLSFRAYGEKLHQLEEKYRYVKPEQLNKAYGEFREKNEGDIKTATNKLHDLNPKVEEAKKDLDYAKGVEVTGDTKEEREKSKKEKNDLIFDAQSTYDKLLKEKQGYEDALKEFEAKGDKTSEEYKKAKDESEKARANMMKRFYDQDMKNRHEIAEKAFSGIKSVLDKEYQVRLEHAQLVKQITDEQYGNEIAAINKSALTTKDKAALDMQVAAQKMQFDKNMAAEERKIKHDQAITDRNLAIAHIIMNTAEAESKTYAEFGGTPMGTILAAEQGLIGAIELATVMATPIPYAEGTPAGGHPGGLAMYGEAGPELVKEPYKSPYIVTTETISYLPKGTEVIPILDSPEFGTKKQSDGWEQTRWLAKQIKKNSASKGSTINNNINLGLGFEIYKNQILGN